MKGQPWPPSSQEELQDSSSIEHSCIKYDIVLSIIILLCFAYFFYGPPFKHLWSLSEVHVQYILPVKEPSLEDDWLRAMVREREREGGGKRGERRKRET